MAGVIDTTQTFSDGDTVTSTKLNNIADQSTFTSDAITGSTLAVDSGKLKVNTISASQISTDAVTTNKIQNNSITAEKILDGEITSSKLPDSVISESKLADGSVTYAKIDSTIFADQSETEAETASKVVEADFLKYHPGVAKAYGIVNYESGSATVTGGYNVTSATDTGNSRKVTLSVTMANTSYVVVCGTEGWTNDIEVTGKTTTSFDLNPDGLEGSGKKLTFTVFGQLA